MSVLHPPLKERFLFNSAGLECHSRNLRERHGWTGLIMDGSHENMAINLRKELVRWGGYGFGLYCTRSQPSSHADSDVRREPLASVESHPTARPSKSQPAIVQIFAENIADLFAKYDVLRRVDHLTIDIDQNTFWVAQVCSIDLI